MPVPSCVQGVYVPKKRKSATKKRKGNASTFTSPHLCSINYHKYVTTMEHTVLILDDSPMMGKFLIRLFEGTYKTAHSAQPEEALEWLNSGFRPHLILLDYEMESMNGLDFLKQIKAGKAAWGNIPILMLSGTKDSSLRITALQNGVDDFVLKPFHPTELKLRAERILEQYFLSI